MAGTDRSSNWRRVNTASFQRGSSMSWDIRRALRPRRRRLGGYSGSIAASTRLVMGR
jgi:hypothetical protein